MKLYLHIGTHKTGTTTIQRLLSANRESLKKQGVWYPGYSEVLGTERDHYAHLDLARVIGGEQSKILSKDQAGEFFDRVSQSTEYHTAVISAEPFYRLYDKAEFAESNDYWLARRKFIETLKPLLQGFSDIEVVVTLRRQDSFLLSLYNESVKATRYTATILEYIEANTHVFQYYRQLALWNEHFDQIKTLFFERLVETGSLESSFLRELGINDEDFRGIRKQNASLPIAAIEYVRLLNKSRLSRMQIRKIVDVVSRSSAKLGEIGSKHANETWLSESELDSFFARFNEENARLVERYAASHTEAFSPPRAKGRATFAGIDEPTFRSINRVVCNRLHGIDPGLAERLKRIDYAGLNA